MVVEWENKDRVSCIIRPSKLEKYDYDLHYELPQIFSRYGLRFLYINSGGSEKIKDGTLEYCQIQNEREDRVGSVGIHKQSNGTLICVDLFFIRPYVESQIVKVIPTEDREKIVNEIDELLEKSERTSI